VVIRCATARRGVRKHVPNDRLIATGASQDSGVPRRELDEVEPVAPAPPHATVEATPAPAYELRACPRCSRQVRYNLTTQHLNSHTTPDGAPCYTLG
jgi:hypothetical protein